MYTEYLLSTTPILEVVAHNTTYLLVKTGEKCQETEH